MVLEQLKLSEPFSMTDNKTLDKLLRVNAPAKINLHLEVLGIRDDGFHELAMLMQSIDLVDELEIKERNDGQIILSTDNQTLTTNEDNLIIKAAQILSKESERFVPGADIYLRKRIPIGAGLAGGSSDGAAALIGLNHLWELNLSDQKLEELSAELGSDVPFCVKGGTQLCFGRGEILEPLAIDNSTMAVLLVKDPKVSVSTPWAYKRYRDINGARYMNSESEFQLRRHYLRTKDWFKTDYSSDLFALRNDLQGVVEEEVNAVRNSLKVLNDLPGAMAVAMSGSGPSCFALYSDLKTARADLEKFKMRFFEVGLKCWCCSMRSKGVSLDQ